VKGKVVVVFRLIPAAWGEGIFFAGACVLGLEDKRCWAAVFALLFLLPGAVCGVVVFLFGAQLCGVLSARVEMR
jgi:hypothetical protein